jgi:hypothetical protein
MSDSDEIRSGSDRKRSDLQVGSLDLGNLNTVKHVHIFGTKANQHPTNYFPNATELIMEHFTGKYDDT